MTSMRDFSEQNWRDRLAEKRANFDEAMAEGFVYGVGLAVLVWIAFRVATA